MQPEETIFRLIGRRELVQVGRIMLLVVAVVASGVALEAQGEGISGFTPIGDYVIEIDGQDRPEAQILGARHARSLLVMGAGLPTPVLIDLATGSVSGVHLMKVAKRDGGSIDLLPNPVARPYGTYSIDGERILFEIEGRRVAVKPKPVLTGDRTPAELVAYDPTYATKRDIYSTSQPLVEQLRQQDETVRVRIYFGTWCPFCAEMVPRVLKLGEQLEGSNVRFEYYGLPRHVSEDAEARAMNIRGVPTGIVYSGGKEIGRISGNSWRSPEQALVDILESS